MPSLAQLLDELAVLLGDGEGDVALPQRRGDALSDAAVADDRDVSGEQRGVDARRQLGQRIGAPLELARQLRARADPALRRLDRREDRGIERDRDQRAGEDQALSFLRQQAVLDAEAGEDERELADLREARADGERGVQRIAEQQHERDRGERLAER